MVIRNYLFFVGAVVGIAVALSGCATSYQSKGFTGGFSETMLAPDTFKIDFAGNGYTSGERASDFAILRAADKSISLGCSYFSIMTEADSATTGSVSVGSGGWGKHGIWATSTTIPVVKPNSNLLVKCYKDHPEAVSSFDANFIVQSIRQKYRMKPDPRQPKEQQTVAASLPAPLRTASPAQGLPPPARLTAPPASSSTLAPPQVPQVDIAATVLSAQKVSNSQACGDVRSVGQGEFQSSCGAFDLVIDCDGGSCHPVRTINH